MFKNWWLKIRRSRLGEKVRLLLPNCLVNLLVHLPVAVLAAVFYRFPGRRLKIIGVTGTDGKTTTATLIYQILLTAGYKTALISTVVAKIGRETMPTGLHVTCPNSWQLQRLLRQIVAKDYEYLVLEVTSHGLEQYRVWGVKFLMGVITNITHEHLDYHKTYKNYLRAKAKLFRKVKTAVLNRDDESFDFLSGLVKNRRGTRMITYGIEKEADFTPRNFKFKTLLAGQYNQYNCLAAIAVSVSLGVPEEKIRRALGTFEGVEGRMEEINEGQDFKVIVDFAHTPNALKNLLITLKGSLAKKGRLVVVFGCAGLRDVGKRSMMGAIATQLADLVVLTAEDPRTEKVKKIIGQIASGCQEAGGVEGKSFFRIPDRRRAIDFAISKARKGDTVVICGKGHERSMCFGTTEKPWSDQKEAKRSLKKILGEKK